jgi:RHH-type proline utilization regulon transcriptional repressor/proline dehydrogenase/delta 1-pyrroline-5-carboxylate dehydrogenase
MRSPQLDESFVQPPASVGFMNEPVTDFSKARNRTAMYDALAWVEENLGNKYPLIIEDREILTDETTLSVNPARPEQLIGRVSMAKRDQAQEAVNSAREAFVAWKKTSPQERADYLFRAAAEMRKQRFKLAALEIFEVGKTWKDADGDIAEAIDYLEYYGREMVRLGQTAMPGAYPGEENLYFYEPLGVGLVISPWNFPLAIPTGMVSAAIVTGNTVLFKPSGLSSICGWQLAEIFKTVGLPPGVLQFVPGPGSETGEYLISHPEVDFVSFTGSREVGLHIVSVAGKTEPGQRGVKRVVAEMGGKNAIIVDETADLDEAVKGVLDSALDFQGQKCSACSRVIVMDSVCEDFTVRLQRAMSSLRIGPTDKPGNFFGPVVDRTSAQRIQKYIETGIQQGNALLARPGPENGFFIGPHLIADLPMHSSLVREEIFGPVLVLLRASTLDAALRMANDSQYALTGGVFSRSPRNIQRVIANFDVGNLYINRKITGALVGRQPFGGFRMSGIGYKAGGPNYLIQFMHDISVSENTLRKGFASSS